VLAIASSKPLQMYRPRTSFENAVDSEIRGEAI